MSQLKQSSGQGGTDMDVAALTTFLSPFLPFLLKLGQKAADKATESAAGKFGEDAWKQAQAVWSKLHPKVEAKEAAKEAVTDVATAPEDEDAQAALRLQLKKLLEQDDDLATAIAQIMQASSSRAGGGQTVSGNQNQAINQMLGGTVIRDSSGTVFSGPVSGGNIVGSVQGAVTIGSTSPPGASRSDEVSSKPGATPTTILILAANPKGTSALRLDQEVQGIQRGLERSQQRDRFVIQQRWAVTPTDVRRALLDCQPQIVHFLGHGLGEAERSSSPGTRKLTVLPDTEPEGLMLEDETGQPRLVSGLALASLFQLFAEHIHCIVLNACYSKTQARAIAQHVPYVIGMSREIGDRAAIEFAIGFYDGLLAGKSVEFAYRLGCNAIQTADIPEHLTPTLERKPG